MDNVKTPWGNFEIDACVVVCPECGCIEYKYKPVESNKSIQVRCAACDRWLKNARYDHRGREQIREEKIQEWARLREAENDRILRESGGMV